MGYDGYDEGEGADTLYGDEGEGGEGGTLLDEGEGALSTLGEDLQVRGSRCV